MSKVAVVTGASSGIGAATARALAAAGYEVVLGARRVERLEQLAAEIGGGARALALDVTDDASVDAFVAQVLECHVLVNCAGGALGRDSIAESSLDDWQSMYDSNVLGTVRMVKGLLLAIIASGDGQIVNVGSIAGHDPYAGGGGYNAAKFAVAALTKVLRFELLGQPVRICEFDPGLTETEFSVVRFGGDQAKADAVYKGLTPLSAEDVAEGIAWVVSRPAHVNIDQLVMMARDQASATQMHRRVNVAECSTRR